MILALALFQAAQPATASPPDIQLDFGATAGRVTIENRGRVSLEINTALNGIAGDGNVVAVEAPALPPGRTELRDVAVRIHAEARIPSPDAPPAPANGGEEPAAPQ